MQEMHWTEEAFLGCTYFPCVWFFLYIEFLVIDLENGRYLLLEHITTCHLRITYSAHTDLSIKFQSHRSRYKLVLEVQRLLMFLAILF